MESCRLLAVHITAMVLSGVSWFGKREAGFTASRCQRPILDSLPPSSTLASFDAEKSVKPAVSREHRRAAPGQWPASPETRDASDATADEVGPDSRTPRGGPCRSYLLSLHFRARSIPPWIAARHLTSIHFFTLATKQASGIYWIGWRSDPMRFRPRSGHMLHGIHTFGPEGSGDSAIKHSSAGSPRAHQDRRVSRSSPHGSLVSCPGNKG